MTNPLKLLAIDLGAESGRAILGKFDGERIDLEEVHRFPNTPVPLPDGLHWNVLKLWSEIRTGLALANKEHPDQLAGIGLDTWGVDFGLLDHHGSLIGNPYHYRDGRTDGVIEAAFQRVPREDFFAQTGIQFLQFNSVFQLYSMVMRNAPELSIAETFLTIPDLLNYWLTGRKVCEFSNATTTQCYDTRRGAWARPLLERMGIPTHIFPEIVAPGTVLGEIRAAVAAEAGMAPIPVIAPACHDTGSAVVAVPALGGDFAWISSGTWSIMGVEAPEAVVNSETLNSSLTNEGGVNGTYRLSKNIMGLWLVQESRRTWARQDQNYSYGELTEMAAAARPMVAVIDPDANDFLKPGDMPARIRAYCQRTGQAAPETHGEIVRTALEGLALKYRWVLENLERLQGKHLETIHIMGGGTQNRLLSQLTADCTGRPVITGPVEATATGNLLMQLVALGKLGSVREAREVVRRSFDVERFEPNPDTATAWDDAFGKLKNLVAEQA